MDKQQYTLSMAVMGVVFLLGVVLGCFAATHIGSAADQDLTGYLSGIVTNLTDGNSSYPQLGKAIFNSVAYAVAIFILGFTVLGVLAIPVIMGVKGFLVSFTVTMFIRVFGSTGLLWAAGAIGVQCVLTLPCLLLLSSHGALNSVSILSIFTGKGKRLGTRPMRSQFILFGVCFAVLMMSALFEAYLTPKILSALVS